MNNETDELSKNRDFNFLYGLALGATAGTLAIADGIKFVFNYIIRPLNSIITRYEKRVEKIYEERAAVQMREEKDHRALDERMFSQVRQIDPTTGLSRYLN